MYVMLHSPSKEDSSLALLRQPVQENENSEFKPALIRLKTDLKTHPDCTTRKKGKTSLQRKECSQYDT